MRRASLAAPPATGVSALPCSYVPVRPAALTSSRRLVSSRDLQGWQVPGTAPGLPTRIPQTIQCSASIDDGETGLKVNAP
jgi:hypothetical protein